MKKKINFSTLALIVVTMFTACQNDNELAISQPINKPSISVDSLKNAAGKATGTSSTTTSTSELPNFRESDVEPKFGKPDFTDYYFKVYELSGKFELSVKLYEKATGKAIYLPMTRIGNYWTLSTKITNNGWYDWRYVFSVSKANISEIAYTLCNTNNRFSGSGISSITWPFGADGSSWGVRNVVVNDFYMTWRGGEEQGSGYGWDNGSHTGYREIYSDDWNRGIGIQDLGADIRSPLDGVIEENNGSYSTSYGKSKFVSVIQKGSDGRYYRFYVAHLDQVNKDLYRGMYVQAGVTNLGTIGKTGASSPHAHCNLRDVTDGDDKSIKFYFDAIKGLTFKIIFI